MVVPRKGSRALPIRRSDGDLSRKYKRKEAKGRAEPWPRLSEAQQRDLLLMYANGERRKALRLAQKDLVKSRWNGKQ